jgi:hypothetical protein
MKCKNCKKETNVVCTCGCCPDCAKAIHGNFVDSTQNNKKKE